jgi:hypothetical protein
MLGANVSPISLPVAPVAAVKAEELSLMVLDTMPPRCNLIAELLVDFVFQYPISIVLAAVVSA